MPSALRIFRTGTLEVTRDFGDPVERFHRKYKVNPETGCWEWTCFTHARGYGILGIGASTQVRAHRFAYEKFIGPIPDGMMVCHLCDVRNCVRPSHLFLGTALDNAQDRARKGRNASKKGARNRKLTPQMCLNMRVMYARGDASFVHLAWLYGVDSETARGVVKGLRHLAV